MEIKLAPHPQPLDPFQLSVLPVDLQFKDSVYYRVLMFEACILQKIQNCVVCKQPDRNKNVLGLGTNIYISYFGLSDLSLVATISLESPDISVGREPHDDVFTLVGRQ